MWKLPCYECRKILEKSAKSTRYAHIIVDEGQDLSMNAFRLLRALAGSEQSNDIFIVCDAYQRSYKNKAVLSKCGINIRGRSSYLKINYRTTEEIRKYAFSYIAQLTRAGIRTYEIKRNRLDDRSFDGVRVATMPSC